MSKDFRGAKRLPWRFTVDNQMQITALCDTFVITRRRHELYRYSKWEHHTRFL